jgi:hypothetical protein
MPRKTLLFEISSSSTIFRIADTKPPMEEVSETGEGKFNGLKLRTLYTVKVKPGRRVDRIDGHGIVYAQGGGRAPYKISGLEGAGPDFSEKIRGTWVFGPNCMGNRRELRNAKASFQTLVDSKGKSKTKVWRD